MEFDTSDPFVEQEEFDSVNVNDIEDDVEQEKTSGSMSTEEPFFVGSWEISESETAGVSPFELEAYASNYSGYALILRLIYIAKRCEPLEEDAMKMLIKYVIQNTSNVHLYMSLISEGGRNKQFSTMNISKDVANTEKLAAEVKSLSACNVSWLDSTISSSYSRLETLKADYKRLREEGIRESSKRALDDIIKHLMGMGKLEEALKYYSDGLNDYSLAKHVIQSLLTWLEIVIYMERWPRAEFMLSQLRRAIDEAEESELLSYSLGARANRYATSTTMLAHKEMKEVLRTSKAKASVLSAIFHLNNRNYKSAAEACLQIYINDLDYPEMISTRDIAYIGTICSLATFSREKLKPKVLSTEFRKFLESEPLLVDLIQKFCKNEFGQSFDIIKQMRDQLILDIYLGPRLCELYDLIRHRAVLQYLKPYASMDIRQMAEVFRIIPEKLEKQLYEMIYKEELQARIDKHNKLIYMKNEHPKRVICKRIFELSDHLQYVMQCILLFTACNDNYHDITEEKKHQAENISSSKSTPGVMSTDLITSSQSNSSIQMSRVFPPTTEADSSTTQHSMACDLEDPGSGNGKDQSLDESTDLSVDTTPFQPLTENDSPHDSDTASEIRS